MFKYVKKLSYPHTMIGPFYTAVRDFIQSRVYAFQTNMIATYDKSIQSIQQRKDEGIKRETHGSLYPAIVMTPTIVNVDKAGDLHWRYSNWFPTSATPIIPVVRFLDNTCFYFVTRRLAGSIDFKIYSDSYMELQDIQVIMTDAFNGFNKYIGIDAFHQMLILEDSLRCITENGEQILDWEGLHPGWFKKYVTSINKNKLYLPVKNVPCLKLASLADSSNFMGGSNLPNFSMTGTIEYELEVPNHFVLMSYGPIKEIDLKLEVSFIKGQYGEPFKDRVMFTDHKVTDADDKIDVIYAKNHFVENIELEQFKKLEYPHSAVLSWTPDVTVSKYLLKINDVEIDSSKYSFSEQTLVINEGPEIKEGKLSIVLYEY